jgi:hypothetical protein
VEFTDFEKEDILIFNKELQALPSEIRNSVEESLSLRFLQASGFDHEKALKMVTDNFEWKKKYFPLTLSYKHKEILNSGFIYVHGRDHRFRPLIVLNTAIYLKNTNKYSIEEMIYSLIYFFEYMVQHLLIPGQVENWSIICDVSKFSVIIIPKELKMILGTLSSNYRCRLFSMYILNLPFLLSLIWKAVKIMLNPTTERKIRILNGKDCDQLWNVINKTQIEKKFGGTAENIDNHYFPPIFPSHHYFSQDDDPDQILVSEEKYFDLVKNNNKIKQSPYINSGKESYFTFQAFDISYKKSEISVYEDAKSRDYTITNEESRYEDCIDPANAKVTQEIKLALDVAQYDIGSESYNDTVKVSYENNDINNPANWKSFEVDSAKTNISNQSISIIKSRCKFREGKEEE